MRNRLNQHGSGLLWFYGLSGSGKSTLAHAVEYTLHQRGVRSYVLDGDNVRRGINRDLSLSSEDRRENIRRVAEVAKLMVDAGLLVMAAFITPFEDARRMVKQIMGPQPVYQCYLDCPLEVCSGRDPKGLYAMAKAGQLEGLTGYSAPFESPADPDLVIPTAELSLDQEVEAVISFLIERELIKATD